MPGAVTLSLLSLLFVTVSLAPATLQDTAWIAGISDETDHDTALGLILAEGGPASASSILAASFPGSRGEAPAGPDVMVPSAKLRLDPLRGPPSR